MLRRPRSSTSQCAVSGAGPRTDCARSTRITSAPMSASIMAANGPGPMPAISMIRYPVSGPDMPAVLVRRTVTIAIVVSSLLSGQCVALGLDVAAHCRSDRWAACRSQAEEPKQLAPLPGVTTALDHRCRHHHTRPRCHHDNRTASATTPPTLVAAGWAFEDFRSVLRLGGDPVRGSGCGADGTVGEVIPDGWWLGIITADGNSQMQVDLVCAYSGDAAQALIDECLASEAAATCTDYFDETFWPVNRNTRERTVPKSSVTGHRGSRGSVQRRHRDPRRRHHGRAGLAADPRRLGRLHPPWLRQRVAATRYEVRGVADDRRRSSSGHSGSGRSWPMSATNSRCAPGISSAVRKPADWA